MIRKSDYYLEPLLEKACLEVNPQTLMDVGCGANSPIQRFSKRIPKTIGLDGFLPSIEKSRSKNIHHEYILGDLFESLSRIESKSIDVVVSLDVIEHFEKEMGWKFLADLERITRKRLIVFTPNGFLPQGEYDGNPHQLHRSGWITDEFIQKGFRVSGINGLKWLKGEYAIPRFKPRRLFNRISDYSQIFTYSKPEIAFQLLAIKDFG